MRSTLALAVLLLALSPAAAQQPRPGTLAVPANASWQHARSSMILPAQSAGLARGEIRDNGEGERDVIAQYGSPSDEVFATIYLFQTGVPDAALWFDRALAAIMLRPEYGLQEASAPVPVAFARPGASAASGLRVSLGLAASQLRSTAVALAPLGDFMVKIRMSSARLDRTALDERLGRFIEGLRWPAESARPAAAAQPIAPCPEPLQLRNARTVRTEMTDSILGAALVGTISTSQAENNRPPPIYCREPDATLASGVYRPNAASDAYVIALNDAGIAYSVGEALDLSALMGERSRGRRYSITLLARNASGVVASFNRLPPPTQALSVAARTGPQIMTSYDTPAQSD